MKAATLPPNEEQRLKELMRYDILDTASEEVYDELTELASSICGTPISLISLVDSHRQWFKSKVGLDAQETARDLAFCAHAILQEELFVVEDTLKDSRFSDNPLVSAAPHIRFYAGMPLETRGGDMLGTLCVIDRQPRQLSEDQRKALRVLARQVISQFELRLAVRQLQEYTKELTELNATKNKFFSIISHDLKSPFNGIVGLADLILEDLDSLPTEELGEMVGDILSAAETGVNLVGNLLEWAMCETGKIKFTPSLTLLNDLVEEVTTLMAGVVGNKSLTLSVSGPDDLWVLADRNMLYSVLQNLISNAVKFTPAEGTIRLELAAAGPMIEITVSDTGVGMSPEQLNALFKIENAVSTPGTAGEAGTGLGLLLCKQFIDLHDGEITVSSEQGAGSFFRFTVPQQKT